MKITAVFHGIMSDWIGRDKAVFKLREGARLSDLLAEIFKSYQHASPEQLWDRDRKAFAKPVRAFTGDLSINDMDTPLVDRQEVIFRLMVAGG